MKHVLTILAALVLAIPTLSGGTEAKATRIALLSDIHILRGTNVAQRELHQKHFAQAITEVNAEKVDLVLVAGDLTENGTPEEMADFKAQLKGLKAPAWYIPGNHDIGNKIIPGKTEKTPVNAWRLRRFEMHWGPSFFTRELPGVRVVGVNSPLCGTDFAREKRMWTYLEKKLSIPSDKPTIMFIHFPPFVKQPDEPGGVYWNLEPVPRQRLLSLARQGGVKAVLSGHMHTENRSTHDGVLYLTTPPVSFGLPKGKQKEGWTLVTVGQDGDVQAEFRYLNKATTAKK